MQDLAHWLENLGMSEYAQRFVENDIDIEVLGELTDTDFDRLGVSIGHRRKLLKALAGGIPDADAAPPSAVIAAHLKPELSQTPGAAPSTEATGELLALPAQLLNLLCKRNRRPKTPPSAAKSR